MLQYSIDIFIIDSFFRLLVLADDNRLTARFCLKLQKAKFIANPVLAQFKLNPGGKSGLAVTACS